MKHSRLDNKKIIQIINKMCGLELKNKQQRYD